MNDTSNLDSAFVDNSVYFTDYVFLTFRSNGISGNDWRGTDKKMSKEMD